MSKGFNPIELINLPIDIAKKTAELNGNTVRIVNKDGIPLFVTADFKSNRIDIKIVDGIVTEAN